MDKDFTGFYCYHGVHERQGFLRIMAKKEGDVYRLRPVGGYPDWFEDVDAFEESWERGERQGDVIMTLPGLPPCAPCPVCDSD